MSKFKSEIFDIVAEERAKAAATDDPVEKGRHLAKASVLEHRAQEAYAEEKPGAVEKRYAKERPDRERARASGRWRLATRSPA